MLNFTYMIDESWNTASRLGFRPLAEILSQTNYAYYLLAKF